MVQHSNVPIAIPQKYSVISQISCQTKISHLSSIAHVRANLDYNSF